MDISEKIAWARKEIELLPKELPWRNSVLSQLNFCQSVVSQSEPPDRLEQLTMGYIVFRELDGWEPDDLPKAISCIQYELQQKHLSYEAKVRLDIHRRT